MHSVNCEINRFWTPQNWVKIPFFVGGLPYDPTKLRWIPVSLTPKEHLTCFEWNITLLYFRKPDII